MAGTYNIEAVLTERTVDEVTVPTPANKFCCMVSFNSNPSEYYEVESTDASFIAETLQKVADDAQALADATANGASEIQIVGGQIVV